MQAKKERRTDDKRHDRPAAWSLWSLFILALLVASCSAEATPTELPSTSAPVEAGQPTEVQPSDTEQPTAMPTPTPEPTATEPPVPADTETETQAAALQPCSGALLISLVHTPVPVTPEATATLSASPTPLPPTPTPRPAPSEDRVGFPEGYQDGFTLMAVFDRPDNKQVRVLCGNEKAASIQQGEPFPHGSIIVMETWRPRQDADGNAVKDENGRFIRESLSGIFVMRKEPGFGEAYQGLRTGEWEYVAFRPDGSFLAPPQNTANCASCHIGAGEDRDWVFRANELFFDEDLYAAAPAPGENEISLNSISFFPRNLSIQVGTQVNWTNNDMVPHTIIAEDGSLNSGPIPPGKDFTFTFDQAGTFEYHCSIHPEQMKAQIEVTQ